MNGGAGPPGGGLANTARSIGLAAVRQLKATAIGEDDHDLILSSLLSYAGSFLSRLANYRHRSGQIIEEQPIPADRVFG